MNIDVNDNGPARQIPSEDCNDDEQDSSSN